MRGGIPDSSSGKRFLDSGWVVGAAGRTLIAISLAGPVLFFLWSAAGYVRDVGFNQLTIYPVRCHDAACATSEALPRIRFEVDAQRAEVVLWRERGWVGALGDADVYRLAHCIVADRTTWTCRSRGKGEIFAFHEGRPLRIDVLPQDAGLVSSRDAQDSALRFVSRMQWYRSVLNAWLANHISSNA